MVYEILQYLRWSRQCERRRGHLSEGHRCGSSVQLRSGAEGAMEAVGHVDGHVGSSQLLERLGVQHQEEGPVILHELGGVCLVS